MEISCSLPKDISGIKDSKLNSMTGTKTIVMSAKYLVKTNLKEDTLWV